MKKIIILLLLIVPLAVNAQDTTQDNTKANKSIFSLQDFSLASFTRQLPTIYKPVVALFTTIYGVTDKPHDSYNTWKSANQSNLNDAEFILYVPIEASLYTRYHFNDKVGIQLGLNVSGQVLKYNRLLYGFSLGVTF